MTLTALKKDLADLKARAELQAVRSLSKAQILLMSPLEQIQLASEKKIGFGDLSKETSALIYFVSLFTEDGLPQDDNIIAAAEIASRESIRLRTLLETGAADGAWYLTLLIGGALRDFSTTEEVLRAVMAQYGIDKDGTPRTDDEWLAACAAAVPEEVFLPEPDEQEPPPAVRRPPQATQPEPQRLKIVAYEPTGRPIYGPA